MEAVGIFLLVGGSIAFVILIMRRKLGAGMPGGKPDCGCGSGSKCKTKEAKR